MRAVRVSVLMICLGAMGVQTPEAAARGADGPAQAPPGHPSPREAFESRRKALAARDWRKSFASSTPDVQGQEVENLVRHWLLMESGRIEGPGPEDTYGQPRRSPEAARLSAVTKKHGVDTSNFSLSAVFNEEKYIQIMASRVADKAAFYEQASEIIETGGMEAPDFIYDFGDLQGVEVFGDAARGWVVWNRDHVYENGVKKVTRPVRLMREFRRVGGRWFNDSRICDYTEFDANVKKIAR